MKYFRAEYQRGFFKPALSFKFFSLQAVGWCHGFPRGNHDFQAKDNFWQIAFPCLEVKACLFCLSCALGLHVRLLAPLLGWKIWISFWVAPADFQKIKIWSKKCYLLVPYLTRRHCPRYCRGVTKKCIRHDLKPNSFAHKVKYSNNWNILIWFLFVIQISTHASLPIFCNSFPYFPISSYKINSMC